MVSYKMPYPTELRQRAVNTYLTERGSGTIEEVASHFNISSRTLRRWLGWFREGAEGNLERTRRPHTKSEFDFEIEKKVVQLKEKNPWLTLLRTQKILKRMGLEVSTRRIWSIWRRFGLGGFIKDKFSFNYVDYIAPTKEGLSGIRKATEAFKRGKVKETAQILNSLPSCPENQLLEKIPDRLLSLHRKVEKLESLFGKIHFREWKRKARRLREQAEKRGLLYLSVRAGIMEAFALDWLQESQSLLMLINRLKDRLRRKPDGRLGGDPALRFSLFLLEGKASTALMRIKEVLRCAKLCRDMLRQFPSSNDVQYNLAEIYVSIYHFKKAAKLFHSLDSREYPLKQLRIATIEAIAGRYRNALILLKRIEHQLDKIYYYHVPVVRAICYLGQGRCEQATNALQLSLKIGKKKGIRNTIQTATFLIAACYAANRELKKARMFLKRSIPILRKFQISRNLIIRYIILGETKYLNINEGNLTPPIRLALLLKKAQESLRSKDYQRAYQYAHAKGIVSHLHTLSFFFPEPIKKLIAKGKDHGLPKRLLNLPVFRTETPVYRIKFLGPFRIYRNGQVIRNHIPPKKAAFLIHLILRAGQPEKEIPLENLYKNFWQNSQNSSRNLSHLLVRIKKAINLSSHLLKVSYKKDNPVLINKGIYFLTDYDEFQQFLAKAKALLRAGEWGFAKKEYLRAFALFRGEPFKKMYDNWSEDMRRVILNKLEKEAINFAKACLAHGNRKDAKKVLDKVSKIIPYSIEKTKLLEI